MNKRLSFFISMIVLTGVLCSVAPAQYAYQSGRDYDMLKSGDWFGAGVSLNSEFIADSVTPLLIDPAAPYLLLGADSDAYIKLLGFRFVAADADARVFMNNAGFGYNMRLRSLGSTLFLASHNDPVVGDMKGSCAATAEERKQVFTAFKAGMKDSFKSASAAWLRFRAQKCPGSYLDAPPYLILSGMLIDSGVSTECALFVNDADMNAAVADTNHVSHRFLDEALKAYGLNMDSKKAVGAVADMIRSKAMAHGSSLPPPVHVASRVPFYKQLGRMETTFVIVIIPVTVAAGADGELGIEWEAGANHTVRDLELSEDTVAKQTTLYDMPYGSIMPYIDAGAFASAEANLIIAGAGIEGRLSLLRDEFSVDADARLFTGQAFDCEISNALHGPSGKISAFVRYPELRWRQHCWRVWRWTFCIPIPYFVERKDYTTLSSWAGWVDRQILGRFGFGDVDEGNQETTIDGVISPVSVPNPVAHWLFNGRSGDGMAFAAPRTSFDATLCNGPTWVPGVEGNALSFDGVNDYVDLGSAPGLKPSQEMTIAFWVNPAAGQRTYADIMGGHQNNQGWVIQQWGNSQNQYAFAYHNGAGWQGWSAGALTVLPINCWSHFVVQKGNGFIRHYLNGSLVKEFAVSGDINFGAGNHLYLGEGYIPGAGRNFKGSLDDVRIYDCVLSAEQVQAVMSENNPGQ